jgi:hypothetical protein
VKSIFQIDLFTANVKKREEKRFLKRLGKFYMYVFTNNNYYLNNSSIYSTQLATVLQSSKNV